MSKEPPKKIDPIQDRIIIRRIPARPFPMYEMKRGTSLLIIPLFITIGIFVYTLINGMLMK